MPLDRAYEGRRVSVGSGDPTESALDGSVYIDTASRSVWCRVSGAWVKVGVLGAP